ncbi:MAG: chromosome segregation protein SMC [Candidatus Omnitrophica bacterium]|nr:chromosome segregation protein SMC [Candidatus Omnitrophota bacterium]
MHLKKLDVCGFKSFAKKTEIIFEKGVTCIVGPNGCGKSNISDAIRWVLGERSAKMLRGSRMEDVIFQGTDFREPINFAEVTLTIDNTNHALPIEFDEVSITRRLYRSGESEYLVNKTACRLKDIQNLILDTGIGSNSYSMIEQGRIDYILSAEAEERRFLIEEAAGISKYKVKKDEAIRKLEQTEQNLLRLNDIVSEVERNIKYAERQARRAEQYKVYFEKLKSLELTKLSIALFQLEQTKNELLNERAACQQKLEVEQQTLANIESKYQTAQFEWETLEREFFQAEQERIQYEQKLISTQRERETTRERFHETKTLIDKNNEEIKEIQEVCARLKQEMLVKSEELVTLSNARSTLEQTKKDVEAHLAQLHKLVNDKALAVFQHQEQSFELASKLTQLRNRLHQLAISEQALEERKKHASDAIAKLEQESIVIQQDEEKLTIEIAKLRLKLTDQQNNLDQLLQEKDRIFSESRAALSNLSLYREKRSELNHRLELFNKLDGAGFASVKEILTKQNKYESETVSALLDLLEIDEGYEVAAAAALAEFSKAVVMPTAQSAANLLGHIQSGGHHQASILIRDEADRVKIPVAEPSLLQHQLIKKRLLDVIKVKNGYEGLFTHLLGNVYVVSEINESNASECARLADRARLVSSHGVCLGPGFQMTFRNGSPTPIQDLKLREKEKTNLLTELAKFETLLNQENCQKERLESELLITETTLKEAGNQTVELKLQIERVEAGLRTLQTKRMHHREEIEIYSKDLQEFVITELENQKHREESTSQLEYLTQEEKEMSSRLHDETKWLEDQKKVREEHVIDFTRVKTQLENHAETERRLSESITMMQTNESEHQKRLMTLESDQTMLEARIAKLESASLQLHRDGNDLQNRLISASTVAEQRKEKRNLSITAKSALEQERNQSLKNIEHTRNELHSSDKRVMELDFQKNTAIERVRNSYHITLEENELIKQPKSDIDPAAIDETIHELQKKVETCGTVNLLAIEEYEETKQRYNFLSTQKKDLENSKESLLEAIRKINRTTKQLFEETLAKVREMFRAYFRTLFQGGEADLVLLDEKNPLDSGLDIVARPPGKKPQHISLLSGGEKALTAIALLFALFKIKPSPFCVLDEIDAPLDEANNERFVTVVREFLENTQFIIVTHSRKTISMADSLYGVTMEEAGVSKIVSVKVGAGAETVEHSDQKIQKELNAAIH